MLEVAAVCTTKPDDDPSMEKTTGADAVALPIATLFPAGEIARSVTVSLWVTSTVPAASVLGSRTTTVAAIDCTGTTDGPDPALTIVPFFAAATSTAPVPCVARATTRPSARSASVSAPFGPPMTTRRPAPAIAMLAAGTAIVRAGARPFVLHTSTRWAFATNSVVSDANTTATAWALGSVPARVCVARFHRSIPVADAERRDLAARRDCAVVVAAGRSGQIAE